MVIMSKPKAPCKECTDRYLGCHDRCNTYIDYKKSEDERKAIIKKNRDKQGEIFKYKHERITQALKKKG